MKPFTGDKLGGPNPLALRVSQVSRLLEQVDRLIAEAGTEEMPAWIGELERLKALAWSRMTILTKNNNSDSTFPDQNLDVEEAARRLGVSRSWLYKNSAKLPFRRKIGHRLVFSARDLERWNRRQCP